MASSWGWGGSFVSSLVNTSQSLMTEYSKDLKEFVQTVQMDTKEQTKEIDKTLHKLTENLKLPSLPSSLTPSAAAAAAASSSSPSLSTPTPGNSTGAYFDRLNAELEEIRRDPATYCNEPLRSEEYSSFMAAFQLSQRTEEISKLLVSHTEIRSYHSKLVPAAVPHDVFWSRYFYRVWQLENEVRKRKQIIQGAALQEEEEVKWDDDEEEAASDQDHQKEAEEGAKNEEKSEEKNEEKGEKEKEEKEKEKEKEIVPPPEKTQKPEEARTERKEAPQRSAENERTEEVPDKSLSSSPDRRADSDFELLSKSSTPGNCEILDDDLFEKALEDVQLDPGQEVGEDDWGSDWE